MKILKIFLTAIIALMIVMPSFAAEMEKKGSHVVKFSFGENMWLGLHYLLQARADFVEETSGESWGKNFYLRRSRIILKGQITDYISFFMETDDFNIGKGGNSTSGANNIFTQDAFITFKIVDEFKISGGLILAEKQR